MPNRKELQALQKQAVNREKKCLHQFLRSASSMAKLFKETEMRKQKRTALENNCIVRMPIVTQSSICARLQDLIDQISLLANDPFIEFPDLFIWLLKDPHKKQR